MELGMQITTLSASNKNCKMHGQYISALIKSRDGENWTGCPSCVKAKINKETEDAIKKNALESKNAIIKQVLNRAAIPEAYKNATFESYNAGVSTLATQVKNNCFQYAENFNKYSPNGIFVGNVGTGKTHLAIAIIARVIERGFTAVFSEMGEISLLIRDSYDNKSKTELEIINSFSEVDLLVIDECAAQDKNFDREKLFQIINSRCKRNLPTIVISNRLEDLRLKVGQRVMDRLESGMFVQNFNWESYRINKDIAA